MNTMTEYFAREDTRRIVQTRILDPILSHVQTKFIWLFGLLKTLAFVITVQTCLLVYLVYKSV